MVFLNTALHILLEYFT